MRKKILILHYPFLFSFILLNVFISLSNNAYPVNIYHKPKLCYLQKLLLGSLQVFHEVGLLREYVEITVWN